MWECICRGECVSCVRGSVYVGRGESVCRGDCLCRGSTYVEGCVCSEGECVCCKEGSVYGV